MRSDVGQSDGSQPTQLINDLLGSSWSDKDDSSPQKPPDASNNFADSASSSSIHSAPQYHLFGLGTTQTQTDQNSHDGGSVKSAVQLPAQLGTSPDIALPPAPSSKPISRPRTKTPSPPPSAIPPIHTARKHASEPSPTKVSSKATLPTRAGTKSPPPRSTKPPSRPLSKRRLSPPPRAPKRARSLSVASQDSFAGPLPFEDPATAVRPRPPQLDIPLEELQRSATQEDGPDPESQYDSPPVPSKRALSRGAGGSSFSVMRALTQQELPPSPYSGRDSSPVPFVGATPSHLGDSQPQDASQMSMLAHGQPQDVGFSLGEGLEEHSQDASSVNPDSSMDAFSVHGFSPVHESDSQSQQNENSMQSPVYVPTQVEASDGMTQPMTQPPTQQEYQPTGDTRQSVATTSTGRRNLLDMLPPEKRQRYQRSIANETASTSDGHTQAPEKPVVQAPASDQQRLFDQLAQDISRRMSALRRGDEADDADDKGRDTDEVPDSEPTQHVPTSSPEQPVYRGRSRARGESTSSPKSMYITPPQEKEEEEGEEEEDEDEIPLAALHPAPRAQGGPIKKPPGIPAYKMPFAKTSQGNAKASTSAGLQVDEHSDADTERITHTLKRRKLQGVTEASSSHSHEVPSSVPQQDLHGTSNSSALATNNSSSGQRRSRQPSSSCATPMTPKKSHNKGSSLTPLSEDDETPKESQQDPLDLLSVQKEEETTEPADDMDVDGDESDEPPSPKPTSRKRKRAASKAPSKASVRGGKAASTSASAARLPKRIRGQSTARRFSNNPATRVFARWEQTPWYYSGEVHATTDTPGRFTIMFDDGTDCEVEYKNMRQHAMRKADNVTVFEDVNDPGVKATVVSVNDEGVAVEQFDGESSKWEWQNVKVASRTITSAWGDRTLELDDIVAALQPPSLGTPSPSKGSVLSVASVKNLRSHVLANTGFVVTMSIGCTKPTKERVEQMIKNHGGVVLEDWSAVFPLTNTYTSNKKRWVVTSDDMQTNVRDDITQVFLISNEFNQKPKYLTSLALGIPCLSVEFLKTLQVPEDMKEWSRHLLPAGWSDQLSARMSQMVDLDWGNSPEHLREIMQNLVAPKIFSGKSILVVGAEYFPSPPTGRGKKNSEDAGQGVPRIIISMGAARVEAVPDIKFASPSKFDYIIWPTLADPPKAKAQPNWVSFKWVKESLIAGRLLAPPSS